MQKLVYPENMKNLIMVVMWKASFKLISSFQEFHFDLLQELRNFSSDAMKMFGNLLNCQLNTAWITRIIIIHLIYHITHFTHLWVKAFHKMFALHWIHSPKRYHSLFKSVLFLWAVCPCVCFVFCFPSWLECQILSWLNWFWPWHTCWSGSSKIVKILWDSMNVAYNIDQSNRSLSHYWRTTQYVQILSLNIQFQVSQFPVVKDYGRTWS